MKINGKIRDEKFQYDINREAANISALSSGKIDKYEYLTGEEILSSNQRQIIQQAKFEYSTLKKAFEKQTKTIEDQGEKQIKALENRVKKKFLGTDQKSIASLFSKDFLNEEATFELNKIVEMKNKLNRDDLIHKTGNKKKDKTYVFQKFKTIRSFEREIYNNHLSLDDALELQIRLKDDIDIFKESAKPKDSVRKEKKVLTLKNAIIPLNGRQEKKY